MKLQIGDMHFPTKAQAKKYVREVVEQYVGAEINEESEHFGFFTALWTRSPAWVEGVRHFEVSRKFLGAAIRAVTGDGVIIEFSMRAAVAGKDVNVWTKLTLALRASIRPQIQHFKGKCRGLCELCGNGGKIEIDHVVTFKSLMRDY